MLFGLVVTPLIGRFDLVHHRFVHVSAGEAAAIAAGRRESRMLNATHEIQAFAACSAL